MINMKIFATIINCAYDLDILNFQQQAPRIASYSDEFGRTKGRTRIQECYILTNDGVVEITAKEETEYTQEGSVVSYLAEVKNQLRSITNEDIKELIHSQLETEAFLDNNDDATCICDLVA